jgi:hypothetical protein
MVSIGIALVPKDIMGVGMDVYGGLKTIINSVGILPPVIGRIFPSGNDSYLLEFIFD